MRTWSMVLALFLLTSTASARSRGARVTIGKGRAGTATLSVQSRHRVRPLRMTLPLGVARQLVKASPKGRLKVSTARDISGRTLLRIQAGTGKRAVIVGRYQRAGNNGQTGAEGVLTVQYGLGKGAKAFYLGRTSRALVVKGKRFKGNATVTRSGWSTFIDPRTLKATLGKADGTLRWYRKALGSRPGRVTEPNKPLSGFMPYGGRKTGLTAASARLVSRL